MRRREFISAIGGAAVTWPVATRAQQAMPVIGFLSSRSPSDSTDLVDAFRNGLREAGYDEGQGVAVVYRWAEGQYDRLPTLAAELVHWPVAVLVTTGGAPSAQAAKAATSTVPIVFVSGGDPVQLGLVASLSRPGGNATGVNVLTASLEAKRLGLLHDLVPGAKLVGALIDPFFEEAEAQSREVADAAGKISQRIQIAPAGNDEELELAMDALVQAGADALLVTGVPFFDTKRDRLVAFAARQRMPAIYQFREYAVAGGLMSYGPSLPDGYRQAGAYAGRILKGTAPADLPVSRSIKFEFVINLKTAKTLGVDVSPMLLARADELIE